jgi:hypothetical protein
MVGMLNRKLIEDSARELAFGRHVAPPTFRG